MEHIHTEKSESVKAVDPVCGMRVDPTTAKFKSTHLGEEYVFCSAGCLVKFKANPEKILSSPPTSMGSGLVSLGSGHGIGLAPAKSPGPTDGAGKSSARIYVCPMCAEVRQVGPGPCPKCGMALEPRTVTLGEEENPELRDMTRRFWVSATLTVPLLAIAMGSMLWPHVFMSAPWNR